MDRMSPLYSPLSLPNVMSKSWCQQVCLLLFFRPKHQQSSVCDRHGLFFHWMPCCECFVCVLLESLLFFPGWQLVIELQKLTSSWLKETRSSAITKDDSLMKRCWWFLWYQPISRSPMISTWARSLWWWRHKPVFCLWSKVKLRSTHINQSTSAVCRRQKGSRG